MSGHGARSEEETRTADSCRGIAGRAAAQSDLAAPAGRCAP